MTGLSIRNAPRAQRSIFVVLAMATLAAGCGSEAPAGASEEGAGAGGGAVTAPVFASSGSGGVGGAGGTGGLGVGAGGTGGTGGIAANSGGPTFCDARAVLQAACHECHSDSPQFGAPMPLATYEDLLAPAVSRPDLKVYQLVGMRIHDTQKPMPEAPRMLSAEQMATLDDWIAAGAPAGDDPTCADTGMATGGTGGEVMGTGGTGATGSSDFAWPADCEEFYTFTAYSGSQGTPTTVAAKQESHPQFYFDVPWTGNVQALAFRSITDNPKVLHHWIMYSGQKFIVGWAPGKTDDALPPDVGMYLPSSGQLRLDMHYNNVGGTTAEEDASGVEICITHTFRKNTAAVMGLFVQPNIPAGQTVDNTAQCTASISGGQTVHIMSVSPHMHKLGTHAYLGLTPAGGAMESPLHDQPFTFEDQRVWPLDVDIKNGAKLRSTCHFVNTTNRTVTFGESTSDEMCINFITYYPMNAMSCGFTI